MEAYISLIPKPEKDHTLCSNYRPISLTNIDRRLYSKIIANRLANILPKHINLGQTRLHNGERN